MERMHGHRKATPAMVWVKLKDHLKVTSYKLLAKERRGEAVGFLTDWMFRINEDRFRDPVTLEERARMYRECHGIAKRYGLYAEMRALMERKWDAESMRDLDDAALRDLRAFMRALEAQHKTATR